MKLISPVFKNNGKIPPQYTCDGADINPPLECRGAPAGTESLVLIVDDPDAPAGVWTHWTVWNIDPATTEIKENSVPKGASQGLTSSGQIGYHGPCPPGDVHRYFFRLYALKTKLDLTPPTEVEELRRAMAGRILASAELIGLYERHVPLEINGT